MTSQITLRVVSALITAFLFIPTEASAKGVILITHGDTITHLGDPPQQPEKPDSTVKVGFKSSYGGLFWMDFWTWGGEFCLYEGNNYEPIDRATAARLLGKPENELKEPFLYRFPLGLLILAVLAVLFGALLIFGAILQAIEKAKAAKLRSDPIYEKAFEIASVQAVQANQDGPAEAGPPPADSGAADKQGDSGPAFDAAVRYLTDSGVAQKEAVRNLQLLIRHSPTKQQNA
jgi:hypothetical protein